MRMRHKKHGAERLAACGHLMLQKPDAPLTDPAEVFGRQGPVFLEIGCGKGAFAAGMAQKHPEALLFAMERVHDVMVVAAEKAAACADNRPDNLRFFIGDAKDLPLWFAPGTVDAIFLNFSDPWPKKGHAKRRLTHRDFLRMYLTLLKADGRLEFKTDNRGLFDFTLEEMAQLGLTPSFVTYDLHAEPSAADNVMTEYEQNFSSRGMPIHKLVLTR